MEDYKWFPAIPGEMMERWPKDADSKPEEPVLLTECMEHDLLPEMIVTMLGAYDIPCLRIYPGDGVFGKILLGMSGTGVQLFVPESQLEEAKKLLETEENEND